jgi:3-methyladenine DNA glycosylase AlkD
MNEIITRIRKELNANADEKLKESGLRFFKEEVKLYGMKTADVSRTAKETFREIKDIGKREILGLCEELWLSGYMEESFIACHWSYALKKDYAPDDFQIWERWIENYVTNWAACDTLCNHTVGEFLEMYPQYAPELKKWAKSDNRWMKRAAAVSLIIPARKGKFHKLIFDIAGILLQDKDDLVQKGYGWMLKAASESDQKAVFDYVMKQKDKMPRTALRYAIEKMPQELRMKAMERYK